MKLPRDLSGGDLVDHLCRRWEYVKIHQVGSHIVLQTATPNLHRISIPDQKALRAGTLNSIVRDVARHKGIDRELLLQGI